jgi:hypothetical protein
MNVMPTAGCARCASYLPTISYRTESWLTDSAVLTPGVRSTQSVGSSTLLRMALVFGCRLTQLVTGARSCFQRARRHSDRPGMPRADAFGRLPLSSLSRMAP